MSTRTAIYKHKQHIANILHSNQYHTYFIQHHFDAQNNFPEATFFQNPPPTQTVILQTTLHDSPPWQSFFPQFMVDTTKNEKIFVYLHVQYLQPDFPIN